MRHEVVGYLDGELGRGVAEAPRFEIGCRSGIRRVAEQGLETVPEPAGTLGQRVCDLIGGFGLALAIEERDGEHQMVQPAVA